MHTASPIVPVFILFDALTIAPPAQGEMQAQLLNYLRKAADDHLAVTILANTKNGIRLIHDMSTDRKMFLAAMDRVHPQGKTTPVDPPSSQSLSDEFSKAVAQEVQQLQEMTRLMPYAPDYKSATQIQRRVDSSELRAEQSRRAVVEAAELGRVCDKLEMRSAVLASASCWSGSRHIFQSVLRTVN